MADTEIGREFRGLPMEHLIGAPLAASTKAQVELGKAMISFVNMLAYGKETPKPTSGEPDAVLTLPMKVERPVIQPDGRVSTNSVTVAPPILGLVPTPSLLIETVDVNFTMEIQDHSEDKSSTDAEAGTEAEASGGGLFFRGSVKVHGKVATHREQTRSTDKTAKYDVKVRARQQPPTEGMSKLMDLMASTVEPIKIERKNSSSTA